MGYRTRLGLLSVRVRGLSPRRVRRGVGRRRGPRARPQPAPDLVFDHWVMHEIFWKGASFACVSCGGAAKSAQAEMAVALGSFPSGGETCEIAAIAVFVPWCSDQKGSFCEKKWSEVADIQRDFVDRRWVAEGCNQPPELIGAVARIGIAG